MHKRQQDQAGGYQEDMGMRMIFVDSNMWCYYFDSSLPEHGKVTEEIDYLLENDRIAVNSVVIMEISHYLIRNLGPIKGRRKIDVFLSFLMDVMGLDYSLMVKSIDLLTEYSYAGIGGRDATILACMKERNMKRILTHDKAFRKVDFVEVVDPIDSQSK